MKMMKILIFIICSAFLGCSVHAQMSLPTINPNILSTATKTDVMSQRLQDLVARDQTSLTAPTMAETPRVARSQAADFGYSYNPERTRENLRKFAARTQNPEARANLEQMISIQPNMINDVGQAIRPHGLDPHNVADAYTIWWINSWLVANKRDEDPSLGTIAVVKKQVRNAFAATPGFMRTGDVDRQEYAEALLLQTSILATSFEQWKNDPKMLDRLAKAAREGAKASGLDLSLMTLTRNGFVPRKGADASGAVGDATSEAKATEFHAQANAKDVNDSAGLGLALAGGAGFGLVLLGGLALKRKG